MSKMLADNLELHLPPYKPLPHLDWLHYSSLRLSVTASEAAAHREKLNDLRQVFLSSGVMCHLAGVDISSHHPEVLMHSPLSTNSSISAFTPIISPKSGLHICALQICSTNSTLTSSSIGHLARCFCSSVVQECVISGTSSTHVSKKRLSLVYPFGVTSPDFSAHASSPFHSASPNLQPTQLSDNGQSYGTSLLACSQTFAEYANNVCVPTSSTEPSASQKCKVQPFLSRSAHTNGTARNTAYDTDTANWSTLMHCTPTSAHKDRLVHFTSDFTLPTCAHLTCQEHFTSSNRVMVAMNELPAPCTRRVFRTNSRETWVCGTGSSCSPHTPIHRCPQRKGVKLSSMQRALPTMLQTATDNEGHGMEHLDNTGSLRGGNEVKKPVSIDKRLSKMDQTIRDFTSHLSQIDLTLGRMSGFGNLNQYLKTVSNSGLSESRCRHFHVSGADRCSTTESVSSTESGRSFECRLPVQPDHLPVDQTRISSSLGTSLTTLSSSVWSSLSPLYRETNHCHTASATQSKQSHVTASTTVHSGGFRLAADIASGSSSFTDEPNNATSTESHVYHGRRLHNGEYSHFDSSPSYRRRFHEASLPCWSLAASPPDISPSDIPESSNGSVQSLRTSHCGSTNIYRRFPIYCARRNNRLRQRYHVSSPELCCSFDRNTRQPPTFQHRGSTLSSCHRHANLFRNSHSPSSDPSGTGAFSRNKNNLIQHLLRLLNTGREVDARKLIANLLVDSDSRSKLANLISSLNAPASKEMHLLKHSVTSKYATFGSGRSEHFDDAVDISLLHLAQSLITLTDKSWYPRIRGSLTSLQSHSNADNSDCGVSNLSLNCSATCRAPFVRNDSCGGSAGSSHLMHFIRWPSNARLDERVPAMRPKPHPVPPVCLKSAIVPPPDVLKRLDTTAVEVAASDFVHFSDLVHALTGELTDEVHIIRILFSWIVANNDRFLDFDRAAPEDSLVGMLRRIRNSRMMYNALLFKLCRFAGIHCQFINGYSKGSGYRPGMALKNNRLFYSAWLAVHVAGGWRFVNVDAALHITRHEDRILSEPGSSTDSVSIKAPNLTRFCDEFYFLTDPEQHIFENFPDHKAWQLLHKPISIDRFIHLPLLKSAFFNANLSLKKNYGDFLVTSNGQVTIKLNMPQFVGISCSLENNADHSVLRGLCLVEVSQTADVVRVQAAPSQPGRYYLHIYVAPDWRRERLRELACSFQIRCSEHNYSRLVVMGRLPEVGFLGPTPEAHKFGVSLHPYGHKNHSFLVHKGTGPLRIPLAIPVGLKICHQLKSFDRPGQQMVDCDSYALLQMRPFKSSSTSTRTGPNAFYIVRMPVEGFFYMTVYASQNVDAETDHLDCVYRVLIDARRTPSPSTVHAFPRQTFWWVYCRLYEPLVQRLKVNSVYMFRLDAPLCDSIAVVSNELDWVFLTSSNSVTWSGRINVGEYLGQVSVYGRFRRTTDEFYSRSDLDGSDTYVKLLDYVVID